MKIQDSRIPTLSRWAGLVLAVWGLLVPQQTIAVGSWVPLANNAPGLVALMLLLSDGTVMAQNSGGNAWYRLTPDSHGSYVNGTWTTLQSMNDTRTFYSSDVLQDGRVLVAGGEYGTGGAKAEVYDPVANSWTPTPVAGVGFSDSQSRILPNGNVLVAPVSWVPYPQWVNFIYNPYANSWTQGPTNLEYQDEASWVKLPDDSILTLDPFGYYSSERYIPSLNQWIVDAVPPVQLFSSGNVEIGPAFVLSDGRAFFLGGTGATLFYTPTGNSSPGKWTIGPNIPFGLVAQDAPGAMMFNGKILCEVSSPTNHTPVYFDEYDPVANAFTQTGSPGNSTPGSSFNVGSDNSYMLDLPDGTVLYSYYSGSLLYVYQPDGTPLAAGKPTISSLITNANGSYHLSGTLFNGISEGAAYGDDAQMDSNFPLVRLSDVAGNVFYAKTYNWSRTSVMTGNKPVNTDFLVPQEVPAGTYSLVVVVNGISSDSLSFSSGSLRITPGTNIVWSGAEGGPFTASSQKFTLTNVGTSPLNWSVINTSAWLTATPLSGTLTPGGPATFVNASLTFSASNLVAGSFSTVLVFSNLTDGMAQTRQFKLGVATPDQPLAITGLNAGLVVPANATGGNTATYVSASFGGFGFYAAGLNTINYTGGSSTNEGLPASARFTSAYDGVTRFQLGAYGTPNNVLLLSPHQGLSATGTLTVNSPKPLKSLSILASSGNGYSSSSGVGNLILHFTNGNSSASIPFEAQDWFLPGGNVAITHFGRIYLGNYGSFYADNPSGNDPNLYHTKIDLAALGVATQTVSSITFTMPPDSQNQSEDTGIFAISGTETGIGPAPSLLAPKRTNSTITLSWTSVPGLRYFVQYNTNLSQPTWSDLSLATIATNTTMTATDPVTSDQRRFYRVVFLP